MQSLNLLVNNIDKYKKIQVKYYKYKKLKNNLILGFLYKNKFKKIEKEYNNMTIFLMQTYIHNPNTQIMYQQLPSAPPQPVYQIPIAEKLY